MSRRPHPLDDAFKQKLEHYACETPEHLWEGIARQRNLRQKVYSRWRERALLAAALLLFVYASVLTWHLQQMQPALGQFPIAANTLSVASSPTSAMTTPALPDANNTLVRSKLITSAAHQPNQALEPLPPTLAKVKSLEQQWTETLEHWSDDHTLVPNAAVLSTLQVSALTLQQKTQRHPIFLDQSKCAAFTDHKARFFFDVLASPDVTFRQLQPRTGDFRTYADNRRATEEGRYNYSLGVRLSAVSKGGMAVRAGLNYSEINERFEFPNGTRIVITYDQNNNIIDTDTISEKIVTNNRYQTLDIPVMVGYEIALKKLTLALNGGAYFNLHFQPKGEFLSPYDNSPVAFSNEVTPESQTPAFRENLGVGWYGSFGVSYKISPRLQLLVEPHLRAYPRSLTRDDFMTDQKYLTAGMFVGLRHQFAL